MLWHHNVAGGVRGRVITYIHRHTHDRTHTSVYRVCVTFDKVTGKPLDKPAGSCECVAHLGWCSHQLALILFLNYLMCFPLNTTSEEFCWCYPPNPFLAQREGCPFTYAVSKEARAGLKCLGKMRWQGKKPPKPRDVAARLIPRVKQWAERWKKMVHEGSKTHTFARQKVFTHTNC